MTKAELIANIGKEAKISKASAEKAVNALTSSLMKALKKGDKLTLTGFGTLSVTKRKARIGINPQTGTEIRIAATSVANRRPRKHIAEPATAHKILKSFKINNVSEYAIYKKLSHLSHK